MSSYCLKVAGTLRVPSAQEPRRLRHTECACYFEMPVFAGGHIFDEGFPESGLEPIILEIILFSVDT